MHLVVWTRGAAAAVLVLMAAFAAGCQRYLDMGGTQAEIKRALGEQLAMPFASVSCPEQRAMKAGDEFECKAAAASGGELTIRVTQTDDAGTISWKAIDGERVLSIDTLESKIRDTIAQQLKVNAAVSCGADRRRIAVAGRILECSANDGTESRPVVVTITNDRGDVDWVLK